MMKVVSDVDSLVWPSVKSLFLCSCDSELFEREVLPSVL